MRRGTTVGEAKPGDVTKRQLAELMVGSELPSPETEESTVTDEVLLDARRRHARRRARPQPAHRHHLRPSTAARCSASPGSRATARPSWSRRSWACARPRPGTIALGGKDMTQLGHARAARGRHRLHPRGPAPARPAARLAAVGEPHPRPPDPRAVGARAPGSTGRARASDTERIVEEYDVRTPGIDTLSRALSGGNQQKLIVGREMSGDPILLIAAHPTRGVDVGAQAAIWGHIKDGPPRGPGGAADLGRPRRADRPVRPDRGHPARPAGRRVRPADA